MNFWRNIKQGVRTPRISSFLKLGFCSFQPKINRPRDLVPFSLKFRLTSTYSKFLFDGRTFFPFLHRMKFLVSPLLRTFLVTSNCFSSNPDAPSLLHVAHLGSIWPGWSFNSPKYDRLLGRNWVELSNLKNSSIFLWRNI